MPKFLRTFMTVFTVFLLFVGGCKKTVEGEKQKFDHNVAEAKAVIAQYPGFKPAVEAKLKEAQKTFDAATSLSGEEQIKKMAAAQRWFLG